ncbi:MAG TPA: hypothetical protein VIW68_02415 [Candidatus Sulfotelmatobacter sp.]
MLQRFALSFVFLVFAGASPGSPGNAFETQHQQALAGNPAGVHFKISLDSGQSTFHIGDTILLKYEFTADSPGKYVAGARYVDRGQRSVLESFSIDRPNGASDPLDHYWDVRTSIIGNNFGTRDLHLKLDSSPQFDSVELTHYLRFSRPGRYRLYVVTRSVLPAGAPVKKQGGPPFASENVVTFQILPQDLAAASRAVDEIVALAHQQPSPRFTPVEAFRLFEIGTPKARKAAASLYTRRNNSSWADDIALAAILAAPTHAEAISVLRARLNDTSLVADENLITELSLLQFIQDNPKLATSIAQGLDRDATLAGRSQFQNNVIANWRIVAASINRRPRDIRASTLRSLDNLCTFYSIPVPPADRDRIRSLHLAALPDLPPRELSNDLLNFRWAATLPSDPVLAILTQIYSSPPAQEASFIREIALKEITKLDPQTSQTLFRKQVLDFDSPVDWNRLRYLTLSPSPDLDADLIRVLEDRWTDRMSRVAPIIGLFASDSILPRVKKVYEVYGADWPCSIESGLLTYFLRVDPAYGSEKLGPALSAYYGKGGSDCHQGSLLVDLALLHNGPELRPFAAEALNDPRPLVAAAGARVAGFGDQGKIPLQPLLARLRTLHDEWPDFDTRSKADPEYLQKWNSGYNQLESMISVTFANTGDSFENAALCKQGLDLCITDSCRKTLSQRIARSKY